MSLITIIGYTVERWPKATFPLYIRQPYCWWVALQHCPLPLQVDNQNLILNP